VQHVGQQKFLMLLLVMQAERDQFGGRFRRAFEQPQHRRIDMAAIGAHAFARRSREQATIGARMPRAHRLIVGVEQVGEIAVELAVIRQESTQYELLKEPGRVRLVPFGRARVRHRLHALVLVAERRGEMSGMSPYVVVALPKRGGIAGTCRRGQIVHSHSPAVDRRSAQATQAAALVIPRRR